MTDEHLVLRHKASGKISSSSDQGNKALIFESQRLTDIGLGGGIVSLLVPTSPQAKAEIAKIGEIYKTSRVTARPGNKSGASDKKALQAGVANDELMATLAALFQQNIADTADSCKTSAKLFVEWLTKELQNKNSSAYKTVRMLAPVMLEVKRSDRWWADTFAQRRKRRVKDIQAR
jgi:hypothetical protein